MKNKRFKADVSIWTVCGLLIGFSIGFLFGFIKDHRGNTFLILGIAIVYGSAVLVACYYTNRALTRKRLGTIDALRKTGELSEEDKTSDTDVIHLANEGKRKEAALVFWQLHRVPIEFAQTAVGIDKVRLLDVIAFGGLAVGPCIFGYEYICGEDTTNIRPGLLYFCIAMIVLFTTMRFMQHRRVLKNRKEIAAGQLPESVKRVLARLDSKKIAQGS